MATTTRRRKRVRKEDLKQDKELVKAKKVVQAKSVSKGEYPTHLSLEDLRQIENLSKDVVIAKAFMSTEEQALRNMSLEGQLLAVKIEKQRELVQHKSTFFEQKKEKYAEYKKSINPKYGLEAEENLGYNPDTGEIVR